jgi:hypothetical protein
MDSMTLAEREGREVYPEFSFDFYPWLLSSWMVSISVPASPVILTYFLFASRSSRTDTEELDGLAASSSSYPFQSILDTFTSRLNLSLST